MPKTVRKTIRFSIFSPIFLLFCDRRRRRERVVVSFMNNNTAVATTTPFDLIQFYLKKSKEKKCHHKRRVAIHRTCQGCDVRENCALIARTLEGLLAEGAAKRFVRFKNLNDRQATSKTFVIIRLSHLSRYIFYVLRNKIMQS